MGPPYCFFRVASRISADSRERSSQNRFKATAEAAKGERIPLKIVGTGLRKIRRWHWSRLKLFLSTIYLTFYPRPTRSASTSLSLPLASPSYAGSFKLDSATIQSRPTRHAASFAEYASAPDRLLFSLLFAHRFCSSLVI